MTPEIVLNLASKLTPELLVTCSETVVRDRSDLHSGPTSSSRRFPGASDNSELPLRVRAQREFRAHREKIRDLPTTTQVKPLTDLSGRLRDDPIEVHEAVESEEERMEIIKSCAWIFLKSETSRDATMSAVLTLWRCMLGESVWKEHISPALAACEIETKDISDKAWFDIITVYYPDSKDPPKDFVLNEKICLTLFALSCILLIKNVNPQNHVPFMDQRIMAFAGKLGLIDLEITWLKEMRMPRAVCDCLRVCIGNRVPVRKCILEVFLGWNQQPTMSNRKLVADIVLTLFDCSEMTHIAVISKYIMAKVPSILTSPLLAGEAENFYLSILRITKEGEMGPYLKLIYPAREIPEMMSSKMPLLHAFARNRAIKEQPNMVQYAPNLAKDKFTRQIDQLNKLWDKLLDLTTAEAQEQIAENYGANAEKAKIVMEGGDPVQVGRLASLMNDFQTPLAK